MTVEHVLVYVVTVEYVCICECVGCVLACQVPCSHRVKSTKRNRYGHADLGAPIPTVPPWP